MKVKVVCSDRLDPRSFENEVNSFLAKPEIKVLNINFAACTGQVMGLLYPTAFITYEEKLGSSVSSNGMPYISEGCVYMRGDK